MIGHTPQKSRVRKSRRILKSVPKNKKADSILSLIGNAAGKAGDSQSKPITRFMPEPPTEVLDAVGIKEWHRVCDLLSDDGILTELDTGTLMLYCDAFSDFHRAVQELKKENDEIIKIGKKNGGQWRNPWYDVKKRAAQEMNQYSVLLGFSPHDRARIKRTAGANTPPTQPANPFDAI